MSIKSLSFFLSLSLSLSLSLAPSLRPQTGKNIVYVHLQLVLEHNCANCATLHACAVPLPCKQFSEEALVRSSNSSLTAVFFIFLKVKKADFSRFLDPVFDQCGGWG